MTRWERLNENESGFVEVLTTARTGTAFGCRLVGAKPGPQLAVAGVCPSAEIVFDRLLSIPTLPWLRGNLILLRLDVLDDILMELSSLSSMGEIDRTVMLPWVDPDQEDRQTLRRSYHMVLRACADLGMISGRGVAPANLP